MSNRSCWRQAMALVRTREGSAPSSSSCFQVASLTTGTSSTSTSESPDANSVTSCPRALNSSTSAAMTRSVPAYAGGGIGMNGGASIAIRSDFELMIGR